MRIVIRSGNPRLARAAQDKLARAGLEAVALVGPAPARGRAIAEDISILVEPDAASARAALAPPPPGPFAVASEWSDAPFMREAEAPLIHLDASPTMVRRRLEALIRAHVGTRERRAREETLAALGLALPSAARRITPGRLLYVGAPSPFFLAFDRVTARAGLEMRAVLTSFAAFDGLHDEAFDAVILNGASDVAGALSLCGALRRNSDLHALPTLLMAPRDAADGLPEEAAIRGVHIVCAFDADPTVALAWLNEHITLERKRREDDETLAAQRTSTGDARTGLFNPTFIERHAETLAGAHHESGRPLSVMALRLEPAPGAKAPHPAAWARGFAETASLCVRLIRSADAPAIWDESTVVMTLPGLDREEAEAVARRIVAIGECTAFAADNTSGPLTFETTVATLAPGESGAGLLNRALDQLAPRSAHA